MSRLIDADALLQKVGEIRATEDLYNFAHEIYDAIKEQPTAYDTEKVVAELEERTEFLNGCTKYGNKNAEQMQNSYSTMMMYEIAGMVEDLIDIVRKGGVE